ncbi:MAG TPA: spore photoproduct lyase [Symbiobacteriaceae bacterium]|nr:spore photoproduct lyase [Symbiobacteriaceae bacterium]
MEKFRPTELYVERGAEAYPQGRELLERFSHLPLHWIDAHHKIEELREAPDREFARMKRFLVIGIRKSMKICCNDKSADFIVPWTSAGCTAMCTYCYLVANWFKGAYLRVFVNRDEMWNAVVKHAAKQPGGAVYEIGSNSDLVVENLVTGNLRWSIEEKFARLEGGHRATLATKFAQVDDLASLDHRGKTQIRFSVNPAELVRRVEIGTSPLDQRLSAANRTFAAGYRVGINLAPIMLVNGWQEQYDGLLTELAKKLDPALLEQTFFELIFMTYGWANDRINQAAFPGVLNVFEREKMQPKGPTKMHYRLSRREEAAVWFRHEIGARFPRASISYIV